MTRDVCEQIRAEQHEANQRTWEELRTLRRLVITAVLGGHLFAGGMHLAGLAWWLDQHSAQPHAASVRLIEAARAETREDLRELRAEMQRHPLGDVAAPAPEDSRKKEERDAP